MLETVEDRELVMSEVTSIQTGQGRNDRICDILLLVDGSVTRLSWRAPRLKTACVLETHTQHNQKELVSINKMARIKQAGCGGLYLPVRRIFAHQFLIEGTHIQYGR
jgi:hypothetical protein